MRARIQFRRLLLILNANAEELEQSIDLLLIHHSSSLVIRIYKCHFSGDRNRAEDRYEEEAYSHNEEDQHIFQHYLVLIKN